MVKREDQMRYIRTKDGRIIDTAKIVTGSKYMDFATNDESFRVIFKTEPLSKSENLEELCDEFVIEYRDGSKIISIHDNTKEFLKEHKYELKSGYIKNVYGAIWVDGKGLIYVAKMNENGKLELI